MIAIALLLAAAPGPPRLGPAETVQLYYADLRRHRYGAAWRLWGDGGRRSGVTLARFRAGFAQTRMTAVRITGPVDSEGAAGSTFATVPVRVDAILRSGRHQAFAGRYVLRRVNDVPGSTAEQRRWHIESAQLRSIR